MCFPPTFVPTKVGKKLAPGFPGGTHGPSAGEFQWSFTFLGRLAAPARCEILFSASAPVSCSRRQLQMRIFGRQPGMGKERPP